MTKERKQHQSAAKIKDGDSLARYDSKSWLLEEYKLLSSHYFHEDTQFEKIMTNYTTLNGALLAFFGSNFAAQDMLAWKLIPLIGIVLSISWIAAMIRVREWRNYIEYRIKEIEDYLHTHWSSEEFLPLDIRTTKNWMAAGPKVRWFNWPMIWIYLGFRNLPSSITLLILPASFLTVWIVFLLKRLTL